MSGRALGQQRLSAVHITYTMVQKGMQGNTLDNTVNRAALLTPPIQSKQIATATFNPKKYWTPPPPSLIIKFSHSGGEGTVTYGIDLTPNWLKIEHFTFQYRDILLNMGQAAVQMANDFEL